MPGEFQASVTMEESTERGMREASLAEVFIEVMSPLTPQPSKLENSQVMQNLNNPQDIKNPLSQVYIEGKMPSMRELDKEVPLDPRVALAAMNEFLENIQQQWRDYGYGPESFHNHGIDPVDIREDAEHEHACIEDKVEEMLDNPDNDEEVQAYEGTTEVAPKNTEMAEPDKFVDTFETYLEVDEEDEPVAYFGTMDPKDEPLEEEVVYCTSICAEVQEGQVPSEGNALMQEDDPLI
ncbi:hypothetical protein M404DRAFT_34561 [Pisolithus tinctorius Marx 270]|uniref:Uncharacterized protein n=1 Tax=Pisolithus tinctorius Marx 270 TaxID=870435 RepID=A0A0C3NH04_PISTI|nr:hypothetical protein M404DRAFT_34561 [Pisolithus tinctorius Marx 270]